ncbi:4-alpha-glucanotransferase [Chloropicon primus]|nr:4-alpha-glucanotransferase [Chloropicon primus]
MHGGAPSSGGADSVPRKRTSSCRWFHVHFRVACDTQWGENLVLIGENDVLGEFEPKSGLWMGCKEEKSLLEDASPPPPSSSSAEASAPASGHDLVWKARISIPAEEACSCSSHYTVGPYRYVVVNHCLERLRGEPSWVRRTFDIPLSLKDGSVVCVCDTWQDPSGEPCVLRSAIFTSVVFRDALRGLRARWTAAGSRPAKVEAAAAGEVKNLVSFRVRNWQLNKGQSVFLLGGSRELGQWEESKALEMTLELGARDDPYGTWRVDVRMPVDQIGGSYKYLVKGEDGKGLLERGKCRRLAGGEMKQNADSGKLFTVHDDGHFRHDQHWKGAGIAVPVFSLRSKASVGCGEFSDLRHLIDFCSASQMSIIQLLPVNDTSVNDNWMDSYPYSSLSAFALHPMYINLSQVAGSGSKAAAPGDSKLRGIGNEIQACREALDLPSMDYEGTVKAKQEICKKLFFLQKDDCYADPSFVEFLDANAFWLAPYATFCALKKVFGHSDHSSWGSMKNASYALVKRMVTSVQDASRDLDPESDFGNLSRDLLELFNPKVGNKAELDFLVPFRELIAYSCFLQFHLSRQFLSVVGYAEERGIALKGDLPIGVDKNSVECWVKRRCFRMEVCAGAPPDYYSMEGQNWGFPTYNWDEMRNDSFSWWKQRLSHMAKYFHAYRIDHILGFFRIWEVPSSNDEEAINDNTLLPGLLGCFQPANAISRSELDSKGIWDIDRLCKPYITAELVEEVFGTLSAPVVDFFLFKRHHYYEFKESFRESNVTFWMDNAKWGENFLAFLSSDAQANAVDMQTTVEKVQKGLRQILQNVVLLRDVNCEDKFHPRFGCLETHSFKALEPWVKEAISEFHEEYFFRRQNDLWKKNAADILPKLVEGSNGMLVCGEDLGLIPPCVPSVMKDLGILGLRIQRMPSDSSQEGEFGDLSNYPYQVVASPSCHDVPTVRAWWEEDYERAKRLWSRDLSKDGESDPPPPECKPFVVKAILDAHLASGACLMIAPLQDWLACCLSGKYNTVEASEERINDPTNSKHYWSFRSHVNVEDLCGDEELVSLVRDMVSSSGRGR